MSLGTRSARSIAPLAAVIVFGCDLTPYPEREVDLSASGLDHARLHKAPREEDVLRFSVAAMQSPRSTYADYSRLFERLGERLGVHTEFVQRRSYREVNDLLVSGELDAALLCTGGFIELERRAPGSVEVVAIPVVGGETTYRSVIIVPADGPTTRVEELRGTHFAFTDELSLTGRAYPRHLLRGLDRDPDGFFGDTILTRSHDRSIEAVASGLIDGAAVDSLVYDFWRDEEPERARKTRVIHTSPPLGMMPVVASTRLPPALRARLRSVLLAMDGDQKAAPAMRAIRFDRFVAPAPDLFDSARAVMETAR